MPQVSIEGQNLLINFPDTMSSNEIRGVLQKKFPKRDPISTTGKYTQEQGELRKGPILGQVGSAIEGFAKSQAPMLFPSEMERMAQLPFEERRTLAVQSAMGLGFSSMPIGKIPKVGDFVEFKFEGRLVKGKIRDIDEPGKTAWVMNSDPKTPKMGDNQTTVVNLDNIIPTILAR